MNSTVTNAFDAWFDKERENGLVDIKLAVSSGQGVSAQAVHDEIMNLEVLAKNGRTLDLPIPTTFLPTDIVSIIHSVSI